MTQKEMIDYNERHALETSTFLLSLRPLLFLRKVRVLLQAAFVLRSFLFYTLVLQKADILTLHHLRLERTHIVLL